ncbi:MAG: OmpA family protein [Verrucomicrobiota bacterium JB025]|nr:OmpA family protein [Verrucomicrobiota bacterium JB025]
MSEEHIPSEDQTPEPEAAPQAAPATAEGGTQQITPVMALTFVVIALLGALIVIAVNKGARGGSTAESAELKELRAEESALREDLNRGRMAMGLRPLEGGSEPVDEIAGRLKRDADTMVALASSFQSLLDEKEAEIGAKNTELLRSEQLRQRLVDQTGRLQSQLQQALVEGSDAQLLRRDLTAMQQQRDALAKELSAVRDELAGASGGVSVEDYKRLEGQLEEALRARDFYEARVKELENAAQRATLFAKSEDDLQPLAVKLFRRLREMEQQPDADLMAEYSRIGEELGANVLHTLRFATGSHELTPENQDTISNLVSNLDDGDLLFVIGYASETGSVDRNRELSSDRATTAAELFATMKRPGQNVQAVYMGQTDRFSGSIPERNQLVELWRIRGQK